MAIETIININASTKGGNSVKSIREEIKQARQEAMQFTRDFGEFSPEAIKATQRLASLKDEMEDLNERVAGLNPDRFQAIAGVVGGLASGISAAQGAMALFGSESEDVQKTLAKVQGAMAFASGIQQLISMQNALAGVATMIKTQVVTAFSTLKGAIAATGIGVLVIAIGVAIEKMSAFAEAEKEAADEAERLYNSAQKVLSLNDVSNQKYINQLKARGKTEEEIYTASTEFQLRQIKLLEEERARAGANTQKFDEEIYQRRQQLELAQSEFELKQYEKRKQQEKDKNEADKKSAEAAKKRAEDRAEDRAQADAEYAEKTAVTLAEQLAAFEMSWALEIKGEDKKNLTKEQLEREYQFRVNEIRTKFDADQKALDEKRKADQISTTETEYKDSLDAINKYYEDKANIEKQRYLTGEIDAKTLADNLQAIEKDKYERLLTEAADYGKDQTDIQKAALDQQVANKKAADDVMVADDKKKSDALKKNQEDIYNSTMSVFSAVSQLFGQQSKAGKAFALAQIGADTARALTGALANSNTPTPDNVATGGIAGIAKYVALAATILTNAARAKQILGAGGSNPSAPSAAANVPQLFTVNNQSLRNAGIPNVGNQRVYVVESDITNAQGRVKVNRQTSVF
jgi:hypothetical protein